MNIIKTTPEKLAITTKKKSPLVELLLPAGIFMSISITICSTNYSNV